MSTIKERIGQYQFNTIISIADDDLFSIEKHRIIKRIYSSRNPISIHPVVIVADPFLFVYKEELYLFYEEQVELTGKGIIKMTKTQDLKKWTKPILVLEENFHLSYPNVFIFEGQIYMMPETGDDNSIRLYTPNDDLTQWTFYKTLLTGRHFADSAVVYQNGTFFLFTTDYTDETNILRMYYTDKLDARWTEHPQSPIANGKDTGRCGGSIFNYNGMLYRPCQLTHKRYGDGLDLYQITALSKVEYKEERLKTIIPNANKIYIEGGHHFNFCNFKNQMVVATDIFEIKLNYWEIAKRLIIKMKM
ncbi:MAG TPA: glycosyl transferase [Paludibacter sp.]|nr:glycosyl transferase [Paludibacter sp.]